jgi:hypothetical protein
MMVEKRDITTSASAVTPHPVVVDSQVGTAMQGATEWPGPACVAGSDLWRAPDPTQVGLGRSIQLQSWRCGDASGVAEGRLDLDRPRGRDGGLSFGDGD